MTAQPTPGPWKLHVGTHAIIVGGGPTNDDIAEFNFKDEHTVSITREEAIANATLFVGAPDLLTTAKEAAAWIEKWLQDIGSCEHDVGHCICKEVGMLRSLKDAIAKAEG